MKRFMMLVAVSAAFAVSALAGSAKAVNQHSLRMHVSGCWYVYDHTECGAWGFYDFWNVHCWDVYVWRGPGC